MFSVEYQSKPPKKSRIDFSIYERAYYEPSLLQTATNYELLLLQQLRK